MPERAGDWLMAAACCEGPQPAATFADLPRKHQGEMVRFAGVAAASSAYFITLWILAQPIASRSLLTPTTLPSAPAARSALLDARLTVPAGAPPPGRQGARALWPAAPSGPGAFGAPGGAAVPRAAVPGGPERRRTAFSRFSRGVGRSIQPPPAGRADLQ